MSPAEPLPTDTDRTTGTDQTIAPQARTRRSDPEDRPMEHTPDPTHTPDPISDTAPASPAGAAGAPDGVLSPHRTGTGGGPMQRHRTDVVAFLFGTTFLAAAAMAFAVQARYLGGEDPRRGAWAAGTILVLAGVIAVVGTVVGGLRRS